MEEIDKSIITGLIAFDGAVAFLKHMGMTEREMIDFLKENGISITDLSLMSEYVHSSSVEDTKEVAKENLITKAKGALAIIKIAESFEE